MRELIDRAAASLGEPDQVLRNLLTDPALAIKFRKAVMDIAQSAIDKAGARPSTSNSREQLLVLLEEHGPFNYKRGAELLGRARSRTSTMLVELVRAGRAHVYDYDIDESGRGRPAALYMAGKGPDVAPALPGVAPRKLADPHRYGEAPEPVSRLSGLNGSAGLNWGRKS